MQTTIQELYSVFLKHRLISTDSRQIMPGSLFFALKGDNFDGNKYAQDAIGAGAAYAVIDNPEFSGKQTLQVNDVLETLQQLALWHRKQFAIPVIAITGSNGKTTTKELTYTILKQKYTVTATKGNLNNHIGVPITILGIDNNTQIAIIEMGANHPGEIAQLCHIAEPTHGLITNIGRAHLGGFGGFEGVVKAKSELYKWLQLKDGGVFVNEGNHLLMELSAGMNRTLYGSTDGIHTRAKVGESQAMLKLDWYTDKNVLSISTHLVGNYNFENVMAAICIGTSFNVDPALIKEAAESYMPSNSRSQTVKTERNNIILDAYNANPTSMQVAIENFATIPARPKMVIVGDMLELGNESIAEHTGIINLIEKSGFEQVLLVGPDFTRAASGQFRCFASSDEAQKWVKEQMFENYTILIKGSRGIKMEKVLGAL